MANPMLPAAIAAALSLQLAGLYVPFLRQLLHTHPLTGLDLLVVFVLSSLGYAAIRLGRVLFRRKRPADPPDDPPGTVSRSHGLCTGPNAEFSFDEPMANSSQLVFPMSTEPAAESRAQGVQSNGGT